MPAIKTTFLKRLAVFAGPGLLVAVGYMDPGNWATDIQAGSKYGYDLLSVVLFTSLAAILLQCLAMKLGVVTGHNLAEHSRLRYSRTVNYGQWILAEIAIICTDVAEVLGSALAFKLLFGVSLTTGIAITALDTLIILGWRGRGFRQIEAIILGLVTTIGVCFIIELYLLKPFWPDVLAGLVPTPAKFNSLERWYLSIGILGATVMPHNLYLHSSIMNTRRFGTDVANRTTALRFGMIDTIGSLSIAFFVNAAILVVAAAAFHTNGITNVTEIDHAYRLLEPVIGVGLASFAFGIALLASGQSSTFTGTIAGQIILEGFLDLKIAWWLRRLITRALALIPAFVGVAIVGENSVGKLLVISQVILSFQLPFAIFPLLKLTSDEKVMGIFANKMPVRISAWALFVLITAANLWLISSWF